MASSISIQNDRIAGTPDSGRRKSLFAGVAGNFIEFYDWTIYAYMAPIFASQMFPSDQPMVSLLLAFSTFALGYIARPLGALIFGAYSDRIGRRNAMTIAILGMGVCSLIMGLVPNYAAIGLAAPVLLVAARLIQGISAGGEAGSATTYLVELAKPGRRAFAGSLQQISTGASTLCALATSAILAGTLSTEALADWGWRIPFIIGAVLSVVGLYLRLAAHESPVFEVDSKSAEKREPFFASLTKAWRPVLLVAAMALFPSIAFLTWQIFLPTFISVSTGMARSQALNISTIGVLVFLVLIPPSAMLSDRIGRKPMMIAYTVLAILWAYPTYVGIPTFFNSYSGVLTVAIVGNIILAIMAGSLVACMVEQFDTLVRATGNGLSYAIGIVLSGATYPPIVTALMGSQRYTSIAVYVIVMAAISLVAYIIMPETKDKPLSQRGSV